MNDDYIMAIAYALAAERIRERREKKQSNIPEIHIVHYENLKRQNEINRLRLDNIVEDIDFEMV